MSSQSSLYAEIGMEEVWPKDVELYEPYVEAQILLPDWATSLSVQTFLRMCDLKHTVIPRTNAAEMSPTGKVPFIRVGDFIIPEMAPIIMHLEKKGITLTENLNQDKKSDMKAYMTLVENVLGNAELYFTWFDELNYNDVTTNRFGSAYPWPLNRVLTWLKRREVLKKLKICKYSSKTLYSILEDVKTCCESLSAILGDKPYYFGNKPTELDAIVFGHIFAILTTKLPSEWLANVIIKYGNLYDHCERIDKKYFRSSDSTALPSLPPKVTG